MEIINEAIAISAQQDQTTHLHPINLEEATEMYVALLAECEDNNSYAVTDGSEEHEFWGATDTGRPWRVHVHLDRD